MKIMKEEQIKNLLMNKKFVNDLNDPGYLFEFDEIGFCEFMDSGSGTFTCYGRWGEGQVWGGNICKIKYNEKNGTIFLEGTNTLFEREININEIDTIEKKMAEGI